MAKETKSGGKRLTLKVSTRQRPDFEAPLVGYVFDANGTLLDRADVSNGVLDVELSRDSGQMPRVLIAPAIEGAAEDEKPDLDRLTKLGAYEPVLQQAGRLIDRIVIPGPVIDFWPFCFCWVRGRLVRASDNRPVCNARVHICEVDRIPLWILRLPDRDVIRLRDDFLDVLRHPPVPRPPRPIPDPGPLGTAGQRFVDPGTLVGFNPQPDPPQDLRAVALRFTDKVSQVALNPQPLPPKEALALPGNLQFSLLSHSATALRRALSDNWKLLIPWFCYWPHWWRFRCDEVAVVDTDGYGNFERLIVYPCHGDHPDLYFWVEYDFGSGFETVYRPPIACNTHWDYACGTEITIRIADARVPGCGAEPDLPGKQVVVLSIGAGIAVREVGADGLTNFGQPFGDTLEPRVDFSRSALIGSGIPYYRWSFRRRTGPNGTTPNVGPWTIMNRDVYRHYKDGTTYPSQAMGPLPTTGPSAAPAPNLFRIRPLASPSGDEWIVLDEHVDLATAYFETASLTGNPSFTPDVGWSDDLAAGLYEMKLELFDTAGNLVHDWAARGIDLRITDQDAPFGTGTITTTSAPNDNRVISAGHTDGFRMIVRVDNNRCSAEIHPVGGDVTPDADCGFHLYDAGDDANLSFTARHANRFATYGFATGRGSGPGIAVASTSGIAGEADGSGFGAGAGFHYAKDVAVSTLLDACPNAAFWEHLDVQALATNGYGTLTSYNASDNAAFALAQPCPTWASGSGGVATG